MEMGYLTVLHVRLGAKIGDLHAKDSNSFRNKLMFLVEAHDYLHSRKLLSQDLISPGLRNHNMSKARNVYMPPKGEVAHPATSHLLRHSSTPPPTSQY